MVDPESWSDSPSYLGEGARLIDGPFHADPACRARLDTKLLTTSSYSVIQPRCPRCQRLLFSGNLPTLRGARRDVVEELHRLKRLGRPITRSTELEHANYWNAIRPVKASS
jgi:hypothetical protein